jgi:hypothetical protein
MYETASSTVVWIVLIAVTLGIGKRLGHTLGPGPLNLIGSLVLVVLLAPVVLLYLAVVESPNEKRLLELENRGNTASGE